MINRCSNPNCFAHDGELCAMGETDHTKCKHWIEGNDGENNQSPEEEDTPTGVTRVPWSGQALGQEDLFQLTPRGRSILVGVLGSHDAGKTTMLLGNYLNILKGNTLAESSFAGSRTLAAWESIAAATRFVDPAKHPMFPPHTPRGTERTPGILHFELKNDIDERRDILLTDAPGEWFSLWAVNENSPAAEGAKWVVEHSSVFLVFADCEKLSGEKRANARKETRQLIERLGNHISFRPTVLVWSKSDHIDKAPSGIKESIRKSLMKNIPHARELNTSIDTSESLSEALSFVISAAWTPQKAKPVLEPCLKNNPFDSFRGFNG